MKSKVEKCKSILMYFSETDWIVKTLRRIQASLILNQLFNPKSTRKARVWHKNTEAKCFKKLTNYLKIILNFNIPFHKMG